MKKSKWHFKLNKWLRGDKRVMQCLMGGDDVSVCQYFWFTATTVLHIFLGVILLVIFGGAGLFAVWALFINPLLSILVLLTGYGYFLVDLQFWFVGLVMGLMLTMGLGIQLCIDGHMKYAPDWISKHFKRSPKQPKQPKQPKENLLFDYIKAKKRKICPLIKLED